LKKHREKRIPFLKKKNEASEAKGKDRERKKKAGRVMRNHTKGPVGKEDQAKE
jgi:hypothetical protein